MEKKPAGNSGKLLKPIHLGANLINSIKNRTIDQPVFWYIKIRHESKFFYIHGVEKDKVVFSNKIEDTYSHKFERGEDAILIASALRGELRRNDITAEISVVSTTKFDLENKIEDQTTGTIVGKLIDDKNAEKPIDENIVEKPKIVGQKIRRIFDGAIFDVINQHDYLHLKRENVKLKVYF